MLPSDWNKSAYIVPPTGRNEIYRFKIVEMDQFPFFFFFLIQF